jgi:hypothetical protein
MPIDLEYYHDKVMEEQEREEPEIRLECHQCNHLPVCKDELKSNLTEDCPYYEPENY